MRSMSLLVKNAQVFNVYLKRFRPASVWISGDRFHYIDPAQDLSAGAAEILDAGGRYMIPGLIDIHMHIESSMLSPMAYSRCAAKNGVTTIVSEPHEVANVKGLRGVEAMIAGGEASPIDMYFGIPSSVPSTCEALETTGGTIRMEEMKRLLENPRVVCVGEIMNYRQIIRENSLEITKFLRYLAKARPGFAVEGHCPSLVDRELAEFLYLGIDADHTEHTLEEFRQRIENGMFMELQAKMLLPEILQYIKDEKVFSRCGFVTDDTMADRLVSEGGVNAVAAKAVTAGFPLEEAICCATLNNAQRMRLYDRGAIAPGQLADFILLSDPASFRPEMVFKGGRRIYDAAAPQAPAAARRMTDTATFLCSGSSTTAPSAWMPRRTFRQGPHWPQGRTGPWHSMAATTTRDAAKRSPDPLRITAWPRASRAAACRSSSVRRSWPGMVMRSAAISCPSRLPARRAEV